MRILAQICALNDEAVIGRSVESLLKQTHPVDEVLIVDNGSTDGTLDGEFAENISLVRHGENLGTSGGARTGLRYGLEHGYDWVWILDADTAPRPDALEKLLGLYERFTAEEREQVRVLAALAVDVATGGAQHGIVFTPRGYAQVEPDPEQEFYECDATIWSGSLFRLDAVRRIGLPSADYVLDWGEDEYAYRGKKSGYRAFVHRGSLMDHNIGEAGGVTGPRDRTGRLGPLRFRLPVLPPIRLYYIYRNMTYFFLYEYFEGNLLRFLRFASFMPRHWVKLVLTRQLRPDLSTCLRGLWDGLRKHMDRRY